MKRGWRKLIIIGLAFVGLGIWWWTAAQRSKSHYEKIWLAQATSDYRYTLTTDCFCYLQRYSPLIVTVRQGVVEAIDSQKTKEHITKGQGDPFTQMIFQMTPTIPELFHLIQKAIDKSASTLSVSYDSQSGYPQRIRIDYQWTIIDDEFTYSISEFENLAGITGS